MSSTKTYIFSILGHSDTDVGDFKGETVMTMVKQPQASETHFRGSKAEQRSPWSEGSQLNACDKK